LIAAPAAGTSIATVALRHSGIAAGTGSAGPVAVAGFTGHTRVEGPGRTCYWIFGTVASSSLAALAAIAAQIARALGVNDALKLYDPGGNIHPAAAVVMGPHVNRGSTGYGQFAYIGNGSVNHVSICQSQILSPIITCAVGRHVACLLTQGDLY
jgi:hypothetical protein